MGNSGSVHNINWDSSAGGFTSGRSKSELNAYYQRSRQHASTQDSETQTQTLLRREHNRTSEKVDRTKSFPVATASEQFKVLPKINGERKLRPTSNGMLLHAGGTISGRNKDDIRVPGLMQRSRTLIFDHREGDGESSSNEKMVMPSFQRSQTLLHLPYKERGDEEQETKKKFLQHKNIVTAEGVHRGTESQKLRHARSEPDFRNDLNKPTHARKSGLMDSANVPPSATLTKSAKLNKYNKKRKAPPAPSTMLGHSANVIKSTTTVRAENSENIAPEKAPVTRRFRTNSNTKSQQQYQHQTQPQIPQRTVQTTPAPPPVYRREKSCDAILLRKKEENATTATEKRFSFGGKPSDNRQLTKATASTIPCSENTAAPKQASKIPQLKRTFYFGMQTPDSVAETTQLKKSHDIGKSNKAAIVKSSHAHAELQKDQTVLATPAIVVACDETPEFSALNYRLHTDNEHAQGKDGQVTGDEESQINDNGILVHIRPALPRRQLEVPSFSPAAAWRMLTNAEEERHKQLTATTSSNALNCESPIQLRSNKLALEMEELRREQPALLQKALRKDNVQTMAWTPQQDLGDDDDDDINNEVNNDSSSSDDFDGAKDEEDGLLFFNGHEKKSRHDLSTKNNEKGSLGVHMFSLSLPRDSHLDAQMQKKNLMSSNINDKMTGFSSLQKLKLTISGSSKCTCKNSITKLTTSNMESSTDPEICEIHSCQTTFRSDNWVLHKTKTKEGAISHALTSNDGKLLKEDVIPTVEPISLSYLTGGKHIMYLPGMTAPIKDVECGESGQRLRKETTPTRETSRATPRQRQRKKDTRESLQDETPVLRHQQPQSQSQSQTQQSTQRFSFQSTVRMLEKRRLAEKLSRDAEIREAQRKSELEAMKRVEEDFQRKRASEKANIRHQLRLYCSGSGTDANMTSNTREQYNSLPVLCQNRQQHDSNNNKISARRADPDGAAASPSPPFVVDTEPHRFAHQLSHLPLKRVDSDCGDSDVDGQNADIAHFNRTASMVEPYLQSFMK